MTPVVAGGGRSQLSSADRAEYHYVERDLRSIGILSAVMAALLLLAWFLFVALDLFR
jgi:uridylate kinase